MSGIVDWSSGSLFHSYAAQLLASTLGHYLWQGALIGAAAALAFWRIRVHEVRLRSAIALLAMASLAAVPLATLVRVSAGPAILRALGMAPDGSSHGDRLLLAEGALTAAPAQAAPPPESPSRFESALHRIRPWALGLWFAGVAVGTAVWGISWLMLRRLRKRARPAGPEWTDAAGEAASLIRWGGDVPVLRSEEISAPLVVGVVHPCILVPDSSAPTSPLPDAGTRVRVLAHEMAHLKRRDPWKNLLQTWTEIVCFFHPSVWYVSRRLRIEREHCCDEMAAAASGGALPYARALSSLEEGRRAMPAFALGSGVSLKIRIMRLLDASAQPSSHPRRVRAAAMIAAAVLFVVCSAVPSTPKPEQEGGAHPEEVLLRMARAYNQRDLELYKTCFAEGFVYQFEGGQWGPEEDLKATEGMFHNPQIVGVEYVLDLDRATMNEVAPDTWVIDGVSNHLTVHWLDGGKPRDYEFQDTDRWVFTVVWDAVHGYRITHLLDRRTTRK